MAISSNVSKTDTKAGVTTARFFNTLLAFYSLQHRVWSQPFVTR
jgi:hypothetical protein